MKQMTRVLQSLALLVGAQLLTANLAYGAIRVWTNAASDMLWSTTTNWSANGKPAAGDTVLFTNLATTGTAGAAGTVNNYVDTGFTAAINNLQYMNTNGYHNTRITNTLTIKGTAAGSTSTLTTSGNAIAVGSGQSDDGAATAVYATVQGDSLNVSNRAGYMVIRQWSATAGAHNATLDLSGLNNFTATLGDIYIGYDSAGTYNRPSGVLILARTNTITLVDTGTDYFLGSAYGANNTTGISNRLGLVNYFNVDNMVFGRSKCNQGAYLDFNAGLANAMAKFRNVDGTNRQTSWAIGDNSSLTGTGSTATKGFVDFTRGSVDALVGTIYVARGANSTTYLGDATGALTFGAGTTNRSQLDVNALDIGLQLGTTATANGTVNVQSNGTLVVNNDILMAQTTAGTTKPATALLNINGGTVAVAGNIVDGGGTSTLVVTNNGTLNLKPAGDTVPGNITVKTLILGAGTITNYDTFAATNIIVRSPANAFAAYAGQALAPAGVGTVGTLAVNTNFVLTDATLKLDIGSAADQIAAAGSLTLNGLNLVSVNPIAGFAAGTFPVLTYGGALNGDVTNNLVVGGAVTNSRSSFYFETNTPGIVNLQVGGAPFQSLTWSGNGAGNVWDLKNAVMWNTGTEQFYDLDAVTFDDASTYPVVNLVGTLIPASVTLGGSQNYTFGSSGTISCPGTLTVNSSGTLTLLTANDYLGGTLIYSGAVQVGNGTTADGALSGGEIQNNASLVFNPVTTQYVASVISQAGSITKRGPGVTRLAAANTFYGPVTIEGGTLVAGNASAMGQVLTLNSTILVTNGGTLDIAGNSMADKPITVAGAGGGGAGAIVSSGATQSDALRDLTMTGDTTLGGTGRWDFNNPTALTTAPGLHGNGFNLTKVGPNQISLYNANPNWFWDTALSQIDIREGIMSFQYYVSLGYATNVVTIRSNATLEFYNNGTNVLSKVLAMENACIFGRCGASGSTTFDGPVTLTGTNTFDTLTGLTLTMAGPIGGTGGLTKGIGYHPASATASTGTGTLILGTNISFTGDLKVQTGTVILTNGASVASATNIVLAGGTLNAGLRTDGTLTLATGQTLKGSGTLTGKLNSPANSTVSPGTTTTAATLTLNGNTTLRGATVMDITRTNTTLATDKLAVTGSLDLGGTLTVTFAGNTNLTAGNKFTLFSATTGYANSFAATNLPTLLAGLAWSNSISAANWSIEVISTVVPRPQISGCQPQGDGNYKLSFSGTAGAGYSVRASTDVAAPAGTWEVLATNIFSGSPTDYIDLTATNYPKRFYLISIP